MRAKRRSSGLLGFFTGAGHSAPEADGAVAQDDSAVNKIDSEKFLHDFLHHATDDWSPSCGDESDLPPQDVSEDEYFRAQSETVGPPMCLLILSCEARGSDAKLGVDDFIVQLQKALRSYEKVLRVRTVKEGIRPQDVVNVIDHYNPFSFLHVECHGRFECRGDNSCPIRTAGLGRGECCKNGECCEHDQSPLCLANAENRDNCYSYCHPGDWEGYLEDVPAKCVYFNACHSAKFAQKFSETEKIPSVGMANSVDITAAHAFARQFYLAIARRREVTVAFKRARLTLKTAAQSGAGAFSKYPELLNAIMMFDKNAKPIKESK